MNQIIFVPPPTHNCHQDLTPESVDSIYNSFLVLSIFWAITWLVTIVKWLFFEYYVSDRWSDNRNEFIQASNAMLDFTLGIIWFCISIFYVGDLIFGTNN